MNTLQKVSERQEIFMMKKKWISGLLCATTSMSAAVGACLPVQAKGAVSDAGWKQSGRMYWYSNGDGSYPHDEWKWINGHWYHFSKESWMETGWKKLSSGWYYLNSEGMMKTGWLKSGNSWYYLQPDGTMASGKWIQDGGKHYFMGKDGIMRKSRWIGPHYVGGDGAWIPGYGQTHVPNMDASQQPSTPTTPSQPSTPTTPSNPSTPTAPTTPGTQTAKEKVWNELSSSTKNAVNDARKMLNESIKNIYTLYSQLIQIGYDYLDAYAAQLYIYEFYMDEYLDEMETYWYNYYLSAGLGKQLSKEMAHELRENYEEGWKEVIQSRRENLEELKKIYDDFWWDNI